MYKRTAEHTAKIVAGIKATAAARKRDGGGHHRNGRDPVATALEAGLAEIAVREAKLKETLEELATLGIAKERITRTLDAWNTSTATESKVL